MNIRIDTNIFNKIFIPFIQDYNHKLSILVGSAGSGKSVAVAQKIIIKSINTPGLKTFVIRNTFSSIRESCWKLILNILSDWGLNKFVNINKSNFDITFINGSEIIFRGALDTEKLKSIIADDIWVEEASELDGDSFDQLVLRARHNGKYKNQITLTTNPTSKASFIYKRWFQPNTTIDDDTYILKSTYKDNKFLPPDYIKSLENLKYTNPTYYRIYTLGEWTSLDKLIYNNWKIEPFDINPDKLIHITGMDFGFVNDLSTIVDSYVDRENKIIYIKRVWGDTGKTNDQLAEILKNMGLAKSDIIADSAEPKSISELKKAGIYRIKPSVKGPDSIRQGIQKLQQYSLIIHPSCTGIITELENYSWEKDKKIGEYINEPIDQFNHYLDALRYSIQILDKPTISTFDKKLLF